MSDKRDSLIFYRSFYEAISELPKETQADVYKAIFEYSLNFTEIEINGLAKTIFTLIKPQLEANNKRFINGNKPKEKQNGSKTEAKDKQDKSKTEGNNNNNNNVNDNVNNNENNNENNNDNVLLKKVTKEDLFKNEVLQSHFLEFLEMRKKIKKPMTEKAQILFKTKLEKLSNKNVQLATDIINQSILNCWQDIYELKTPKENDKPKRNTSEAYKAYLEQPTFIYNGIGESPKDQ